MTSNLLSPGFFIIIRQFYRINNPSSQFEPLHITAKIQWINWAVSVPTLKLGHDDKSSWNGKIGLNRHEVTAQNMQCTNDKSDYMR